MDKIDAQRRILRNLAVIKHQVASLARNGQNISIYTETAIRDALNATTGFGWMNLNAAHNNFPAVDLITADGSRAVQATLHTTKQKLDETVEVVEKTLDQNKGSRPAVPAQVEVVGLTCVKNPKVTGWRRISGGRVRLRGIDLLTLLDLHNLSADGLAELDRVLQSATTTSPYHLNSDEAELQKLVPWLDRPALRDHRSIEQSWVAMEEAMLSIRRLIAQGADDFGHPYTRPYPTFQPRVAQLLRSVYDESAEISRLLRNELSSPGTMTDGEGVLVEGHRLRMQELVVELALHANLPPPIW